MNSLHNVTYYIIQPLTYSMIISTTEAPTF